MPHTNNNARRTAPHQTTQKSLTLIKPHAAAAVPATKMKGDLALGTGEVHVLLLEGCGAREVLAGGYVALLAKRLLVGRGLNRPPPGRRRRRAMRLLLPPRTGSDEPGIQTYIYIYIYRTKLCIHMYTYIFMEFDQDCGRDFGFICCILYTI